MENNYITVVVLYGDEFDVTTRKLYIEYPSDNPTDVINEYLAHVYPSIGHTTAIHVDNIFVNNQDLRLFAVFGSNGDLNTIATNIIRKSWNMTNNDSFQVHGPIIFFTVAMYRDVTIDFTAEMFHQIF